MATSNGSVASIRRAEAKEFRLIFMASFVVFLVAAIVGRILPWGGHAQRVAADGHKSIIGEAKTAANTFVPFIFMA